MNRRQVLKVTAALPLLQVMRPTSAAAQAAWPTHTVTMIVPFPAGGQADLAARPVALALEKILGKSVIVDNRAGGAGGAIGNAAAARAEPDGYTLLMTLSSLAVLPEADRLFDRPPVYEVSNSRRSRAFLPIPPCLRCRRPHHGRRCRILSTMPKAAPVKFPMARPVRTARCTWRWKCLPPLPA
jgi:Tripartite tricarboxylate transporter family receptor